jgi:hypothetical protein
LDRGSWCLGERRREQERQGEGKEWEAHSAR